MSKRKSHSESTQKKEPNPAGVPKVPPIQNAMVEMAWQVALPFMALALGGNWLDGRYDTSPLFTLIGVFLGLVAVTVLVHRLVERHFPGTFKKEDE